MTMRNNMGVLDRVIRFVLAILAVIFVVTSFIGFCPLYVPFNLSTKPKEQG
jgi:hypothetical protein